MIGISSSSDSNDRGDYPPSEPGSQEKEQVTLAVEWKKRTRDRLPLTENGFFFSAQVHWDEGRDAVSVRAEQGPGQSSRWPTDTRYQKNKKTINRGSKTTFPFGSRYCFIQIWEHFN